MARFRIRNKYIRITLIVLVCLVFAALITLYLGREWLLKQAMTRVQTKLKDKYDITLQFRDYHLSGTSTVIMEGINCQTAAGDTLAYFDHVDVQIWLLPLLRGKLRLGLIEAHKGMADLGRIKDVKGRDTTKLAETGDTTRLGRLRKYLHYLQEAAMVVPDRFSVMDVAFRYQDTVDQLYAHVDRMLYETDKLDATMQLRVQGQQHRWHAQGTFHRDDLKTDMKVTTDDTTFLRVNFIRRLAKAEVGFRSIRIKLDEIEDDENHILAKGTIGGEKVLLYNPRLSPDTIRVNNGKLDMVLNFDTGKVALQEGSLLTLNTVPVGMQASYQFRNPKEVYLKVLMPMVAAQNVINALPKGTFDGMQGMQIDGYFRYKLDFYVNLTTKDSIIVDSDLDGKDLNIRRYGKADLSKLNREFVYQPYNSKRLITVGPSNPDYTPLNRVSRYLINAILSMEDPRFRHHKGFEEYAFAEAFLENLKKDAFKRGGSTISQQLVKNVFLTHRKTIDRKVEEAFLVWLIENMNLVSKNRMLEVYVNVIEWGPNVYGVSEACRFYFNKVPDQLTLAEAIFMAHIIRAPRRFMSNFDVLGNLRPFAQRKEQATAYTMYRRRLISEEDWGSFWPEVRISGPALKHLRLVPKDTANKELDKRLIEEDW